MMFLLLSLVYWRYILPVNKSTLLFFGFYSLVIASQLVDNYLLLRR